jgi:chromosome segregation ATPase
MDASDRDLLERIQTVFDIGNPEQMKVYDDIIAEKDQTKRLIKLGTFLLDISQSAQRRSRQSIVPTSRLITQTQYLIAVLQSLTSHPEMVGDILQHEAICQIPRTFFEEQAKRLREAAPSLHFEHQEFRSFQEICVKLTDLKRTRIQIESIFNLDELKEHCANFAALFEYACLLNDVLLRRPPISEKTQNLLNAQLKNQSSQISALKKENQQLLQKLQESELEKNNHSETQVEDLKSQIEAAKERIDTQHKLLKKLKSENRQLSVVNVKLMADLEETRALNESNAVLLSKLSELQQKLSESESQVTLYTELKAHAKELRRENGKLTKENSSLRQAQLIPRESEEKIQTENAKLVKENDLLRKEIATLRDTEFKELCQTNEHLTRSLSEKQGENTQIERQNAELQSKIHTIESETEKYRKLIQTLASENEKRKLKFDTLNQQVEAHRQSLQRSLTENEFLSKEAVDYRRESEQLKQSITELESTNHKLGLENQRLQRIIEDDRLLHEKTNTEVRNQIQIFFEERCEIETSLRRANETIEDLGKRCDEMNRISEKREAKCVALKEKVKILQSTSGLSELKGQFLALQKSYENVRRLNSVLSNENESFRETQESFIEIGRALADAIGDVFLGRQPIHEVKQLIEKVRTEHGRTLLLEKFRRESQPPVISLPRIDELDREIRTLQRVLVRPSRPFNS